MVKDFNLNISSQFSINSEAFASELIENCEQIPPRYRGGNYLVERTDCIYGISHQNLTSLKSLMM